MASLNLAKNHHLSTSTDKRNRPDNFKMAFHFFPKHKYSLFHIRNQPLQQQHASPVRLILVDPQESLSISGPGSTCMVADAVAGHFDAWVPTRTVPRIR